MINMKASIMTKKYRGCLLILDLEGNPLGSEPAKLEPK